MSGGFYMLRVFEAFSGVGAQRMALRNLGIDHEIVGISEIDKYAIQSYEAIHGKTPNFGDISTINPNELPDFDLFTYSFPCQDLSVVGKQEGLIRGKTRSGLLYECEKIIEVKRPKYLLLENVKNLMSQRFQPAFQAWQQYLTTLGYTNYVQVLDAKDYGIPQHRQRVFMVSILEEHEPYHFPQPIPLTTTLMDVLEDSFDPKMVMTVKDNSPSKRTLTYLEQVQQLVTNLEEEHAWMGVDKSLNQPRLTPIANCLTAREDRGISNHRQEGTAVVCPLPFLVRKLTPLECWRLMGFLDEDFEKAKASGLSNAQLYKQAGNSIVVSVLEGIFKQLFSKLKTIKKGTD